MSVKSAVIDLSATTAYPGTPQFDAGFIPDTIFLVNEGQVHDVKVSFDGINDHLILYLASETSGPAYWQFRCNRQQVWFKSASGASGAARITSLTDT